MYTYIRKMNEPKIEAYRVPQFSRLGSEKTCSGATKKFLFERNNLDHLMTEYVRLIYSIFSNSTTQSSV